MTMTKNLMVRDQMMSRDVQLAPSVHNRNSIPYLTPDGVLYVYWALVYVAIANFIVGLASRPTNI